MCLEKEIVVNIKRTYSPPTYNVVGLDGVCQCFFPSGDEPPSSSIEQYTTGRALEGQIQERQTLWGSSEVQVSRSEVFGNNGKVF